MEGQLNEDNTYIFSDGSELEMDDFFVEYGETVPIEILKDKVTDFLLENNKVMIKESDGT